MKRSNVTSYIFIIIIVYFRLFDVDNNKRVDDVDLGNIMKMLFGSRMIEEDMKMLSDKIFEEADTGQKGYLDYEDI
jgi:Ca2+-binding EF-hand superfamily protein